MLDQVRAVTEALPTLGTLIRLFSRVGPLVGTQMRTIMEAFPTFRAFVGLVSERRVLLDGGVGVFSGVPCAVTGFFLLSPCRTSPHLCLAVTLQESMAPVFIPSGPRHCYFFRIFMLGILWAMSPRPFWSSLFISLTFTMLNSSQISLTFISCKGAFQTLPLQEAVRI